VHDHSWTAFAGVALSQARRRGLAFQFADPLALATERGQTRQVFVNSAERNPKKWQQMEFEGVVSATKEAWPCRA
jgi:hypothetical protein